MRRPYLQHDDNVGQYEQFIRREFGLVEAGEKGISSRFELGGNRRDSGIGFFCTLGAGAVCRRRHLLHVSREKHNALRGARIRAGPAPPRPHTLHGWEVGARRGLRRGRDGIPSLPSSYQERNRGKGGRREAGDHVLRSPFGLRFQRCYCLGGGRRCQGDMPPSPPRAPFAPPHHLGVTPEGGLGPSTDTAAAKTPPIYTWLAALAAAAPDPCPNRVWLLLQCVALVQVLYNVWMHGGGSPQLLPSVGAGSKTSIKTFRGVEALAPFGRADALLSPVAHAGVEWFFHYEACVVGGDSVSGDASVGSARGSYNICFGRLLVHAPPSLRGVDGRSCHSFWITCHYCFQGACRCAAHPLLWRPLCSGVSTGIQKSDVSPHTPLGCAGLCQPAVTVPHSCFHSYCVQHAGALSLPRGLHMGLRIRGPCGRCCRCRCGLWRLCFSYYHR